MLQSCSRQWMKSHGNDDGEAHGTVHPPLERRRTHQLLLMVLLRRRLMLLIRQPTLSVSVWALRIPLGVHLAVGVLRGAVDLLRLRILALGSWLVADRRELGTAHLMRHHPRLSVLAGRWLRILAIASGVLSLPFLFLLALIILFLLLGCGGC